MNYDTPIFGSQESEIFSLPFFAKYITPYAQKISFMTPAIWAVCYFLAGILVRKPSLFFYPYDDKSTYESKRIAGPRFMMEVIWKDDAQDCDLDACAFLLDAD